MDSIAIVNKKDGNQVLSSVDNDNPSMQLDARDSQDRIQEWNGEQQSTPQVIDTDTSLVNKLHPTIGNIFSFQTDIGDEKIIPAQAIATSELNEEKCMMLRGAEQSDEQGTIAVEDKSAISNINVSDKILLELSQTCNTLCIDESKVTERASVIIKQKDALDTNEFNIQKTKDEIPNNDEDSCDEVSSTLNNQGRSSFHDIPVIQSSSTKMLVDANSEWSCFIASEEPEVEQSQISSLRQSLETELLELPKFPELVGDVRLLRFLRGSLGNVSAAANSYREMLKLRAKHNLNTVRDHIVASNLTSCNFPHFDKISPHAAFLNAYNLFDVTDTNVFYFEMSGLIDFHALQEAMTDSEWMEYHLYEMEYRAIQLDRISRLKEKVVRTVFVRDLSGFSISCIPSSQFLKRTQELIKVACACYPESSAETVLLHAPWLFSKSWDALTSYITEKYIPSFPRTLKKLNMSNNSYNHLLDVIGGRDRLPHLLGGKNLELVIPQTGFLARDSYLLLCENGGTRTDIKAGRNLQLPYRVCANDTICWEFALKQMDIKFGVNFRIMGEDGGAKEVERVKMTLFKATGNKDKQNHGSFVGSFTATEDGIAVLNWDNEYSWSKSKSIVYKVKIVKATHDFSTLDICNNDCV